jgi:hypothetical protein
MAMSEVKERGLPPEVAGWLDRLNDLVENVKSWAEAAGWKPSLTSVDLTEKEYGRYEAPVLVLTRDEVVVSLVPVARQVPKADGLVGLYLMPEFDDMASLYLEEGGRWFLHYAFHPDPMEARSVIETERLSLDQANLDRVLDDIAAHA